MNLGWNGQGYWLAHVTGCIQRYINFWDFPAVRTTEHRLMDYKLRERLFDFPTNQFL